MFAFSERAIAHKSKAQTMTASSSTESEFVAAFTAAMAAWHPRFILQELGFPQNGPSEIHVDDQATLQIVKNDQAPAMRARHLDSRFFSPQDQQEEEPILMIHVAGVLNLLDDLSTKPLAHCLHARHCLRMMGHFN